MPVVLRLKGYKFWFYEADLAEPPHVHVGKAGREAKYWIDPIALVRAGRFREHELDEIEKILDEYRGDLLESWREEKRKHVNG
jgi:hypothetical protein